MKTEVPACQYRGATGGMFPQGYAKPSPQEHLVSDEDASEVVAVGVGDKCVQLSHDMMVLRGRGVEQGQLQPSLAGCTGLSPIVRHLDYVDYKNVFLLPAYHGLVYGLGKNFLNLILEVSLRQSLLFV